MQRKSANVSKNVLAISERRKSSSKILVCQRSTMVVHKINSSKTSSHIRLVGGADVSVEPDVEKTLVEASPAFIQEISAPPPSNPPTLSPSSEKRFIDSLSVKESTRLEIIDNKSHEDKQLSANSPCCFCVSQTPLSVGDRKVDEIIEYVHQNLEEAGKALATLGDNFEHDLKVEPHIQVECHKTVSTSRGRKRRGYN
ncbi:hypothetical protein ACFW04_003818 [Cataglyphis niger]